jgi:L-asparaginase
MVIIFWFLPGCGPECYEHKPNADNKHDAGRRCVPRHGEANPGRPGRRQLGSGPAINASARGRDAILADDDRHTGGPVAVIALGGTIAMTHDESGAATPTLSAEQLLSAVPGLVGSPGDLAATTFRSRPGASLTFEDLFALAEVIRQRLDAGAAGVVVTQGTDTIEETAYFLDLLHRGPQPVVVTGAMRNPSLAGADGPANILAAIAVARSAATRDLGVVVVFNDEIHAARRVRKTHSSSTGTFASPNGGPLGYLIEGHPHVVNRLTGRFAVIVRNAGTHSRVGVYPASQGDDGGALASFAAQFDGLVVAGFGVGHVPESWVPVIADLVPRMPVVLASRTGAGPVLAGTYSFAGSERDLRGRGMIGAGLLDAYKARILLQLALSTGASGADIAAAFEAAGGLGDPGGWPWPAEDG